MEVQGKVKGSSADDDYFGFALPFQPGDTSNSSASYLLVDWKQNDQYHDFGSPSTTLGTTALRGLALSQVTGIPTADEFWGHTDFTSHPSGGLTELARGNTLGSAPWQNDFEHQFRFLFLPTQLKVFVDGTLEFDISGTFSDGRFALYDFSQPGATFSDFEARVIPEPTTIVGLLSLGAMALVAFIWRRRNRTA
jgi:hypothetical protein